MLKSMKTVYIVGFVLMTLFGAYYYQDILLQRVDMSESSSINVTEKVASVERRFNIDGMYCDSCRVKVESEVKKIPGVLSVQVDIDTSEMSVRYHSNQEHIKETLAAVKSLGYTPGLKSDSGQLQVLDFKVTFQ
ncbi:MAG: cation transporter [Candidatus Marinamargulisbacteria bacterium]